LLIPHTWCLFKAVKHPIKFIDMVREHPSLTYIPGGCFTRHTVSSTSMNREHPSLTHIQLEYKAHQLNPKLEPKRNELNSLILQLIINYI
jgi:hypothetical protein